MLCAALTSGKYERATNDLMTSSSLNSALWTRVKQHFLSWGKDTVPTSLWAAGFSFFPALWIIQISYSHPPVRTRGDLTPLILQSLPPTSPTCSLCSQFNHMWPCVLCSVLLQGLWVYMINKLLFISSVQCLVLCVWQLPSP